MDKNNRICSVDGCGKGGQIIRGYCRKHYYRWKTHGSTDDEALSRTPAGYARDFLMKAVASATDECIVWPYDVDDCGYGRIFYEGKVWQAPRLCLVMTKGDPPDGDAVAAHAPVICHNPKCINPRHLRWATRTENMLDRVLDGTVNDAKLTEADVLAIRASKKPVKFLAEKYAVATNTIYDVRGRKRWAWL